MHLNKYSELQQRLENEEFEVSRYIIYVLYKKLIRPLFPQQVELGADVYQQLLAIYLYQNKL